MNVLETMAHHIDAVRDWYDNLEENEKNSTAVYMVIGDMEGKYNCDFLAGRAENIIYTLAQSMVNDHDFYEVAKEAVEIARRYKELQYKEMKESVGETSPKVVS